MRSNTKEVTVAFVRRYTLMDHTCPVCGDRFEGPRLKVYCSPKCYRKAAWERNGGKANAKRRSDGDPQQQSGHSIG